MQAREFLQIDVVVLSILIYVLLGKLADSLARGNFGADRAIGNAQPRHPLHPQPGINHIARPGPIRQVGHGGGG